MNTRKRLERLEATRGTAADHYETPVYLSVYLKHLENERRKQAREPPVPLTPEEERLEREMDNNPKHLAYWKMLDEQRKERLWREKT